MKNFDISRLLKEIGSIPGNKDSDPHSIFADTHVFSTLFGLLVHKNVKTKVFSCIEKNILFFAVEIFFEYCLDVKNVVFRFMRFSGSSVAFSSPVKIFCMIWNGLFPLSIQCIGCSDQ